MFCTLLGPQRPLTLTRRVCFTPLGPQRLLQRFSAFSAALCDLGRCWKVSTIDSYSTLTIEVVTIIAGLCQEVLRNRRLFQVGADPRGPPCDCCVCCYITLQSILHLTRPIYLD